MAPVVHSQWLEHGWWIEAEGMHKSYLWITDFTVEEGRYWIALGHSFGVIEAMSGTANGRMPRKRAPTFRNDATGTFSIR